jgi:hypothetical protein
MKVHKITWKGIKKKVASVGKKKIGIIFKTGSLWRWESPFYKGELIPIGFSEFSVRKMVESNYLRSLKRK